MEYTAIIDVDKDGYGKLVEWSPQTDEWVKELIISMSALEEQKFAFVKGRYKASFLPSFSFDSNTEWVTYSWEITERIPTPNESDIKTFKDILLDDTNSQESLWVSWATVDGRPLKLKKNKVIGIGRTNVLSEQKLMKILRKEKSLDKELYNKAKELGVVYDPLDLVYYLIEHEIIKINTTKIE